LHFPSIAPASSGATRRTLKPSYGINCGQAAWDLSNFGASFRSGNSSSISVVKIRRLVIELDGGQHGEPKGVAADSRRTRALEAWGYRVIRFWDNDVLQNMDGVVQAILEALGEGV
jgi:Protein of unknown function (DUF559)